MLTLKRKASKIQQLIDMWG